MRQLRFSFLSLGLLALGALSWAQGRITTTREAYGFTIGDDYRLANYTQFAAYLKTLAKESDRMTLEVIGQTAEGRDQLMAIITSPANHNLLAKYKGISQRLARAEGLSEAQARALAREGKAVVWIDGGLHATEVLGAAQLVETVYQLVSRTDEETMRLLNDVIVLAVHANPDGMELVSNWYMKDADEKARKSSDIPRPYQKYVGHDNNRDFYALNQPESRNMARQLSIEWIPQIVYNHHQSGPTGAVLFAPFRDPFNYNLDPLIVTSLDLVGASMHSRFIVEGKPGATMRRGANYSTWWNGGLRTAVYFHNQIGLLTETIGNPTPIEIEFVPQRALPSGDTPFPVAPQTWHFRQSIEYSVTANYAVLDIASRHREQFLYNIYKMGRNSIERGSRDHWTVWPKDIEAVRAVAEEETRAPLGPASTINPAVVPGGLFAASQGGRSPVVPAKYFDDLRKPEDRDARGYILPADQRDFPTAVKFINALQRSGIVVHRATADFMVAGKSYPKGSLVVKTAQAFRPHILDMFEPQDHPNDFASPGGPPIPPYDNAGWTLAYQMGVQFDRVLDNFDGPFQAVDPLDLVMPIGVAVEGSVSAAGFLLPAAQNDSVTVVNRVLKAGGEVHRITGGSEQGGYYVLASPVSTPIVNRAAAGLGVSAKATARPSATQPLKTMRIGLADRYGGSMPAGWIRWILEQFEFPSVEQVYPQTMDAGNLQARYDVLIFADGILPERDGPAAGSSSRQPSAERAGEFAPWLGDYTVAKSVPAIKEFIEAGGRVMAIGGSTSIGHRLGLLENHLVEPAADGPKSLGRDKYYVPGSVLRAEADTTHPLAWGLARAVDVLFDNSPVYGLKPDSALRGVTPVAWFPDARPLRSGWAWGQHYLEGGVLVAEAKVGEGRLMLFGPEITFRAQPHGTFKFLFNGIFR